MRYDNTELNGNTATNLKTYTATDNLFKFDLDSADVNENYTGSAKGYTRGLSRVSLAASDKYYTIMSNNSVSMRLFLNSANDNKWDNSGNWSPNGVPESTDGVIIGNFTVYLNGNSNSFKCKNLYLTDGKSKLIPYTSDSFGSLLKLKNVTINNIGNNNFTPIGNIEIQGDFTYNNGAIANNGSFLPQNGSVIFSGPTDKYLNNYANADEVKFYNIEINKKASVYTYSSFSIRGNFTLRIDCRFKAEAGTVYFIDDDVPSAIINENGR